MSLAEEIEAELTRVLTAVAQEVHVEPGPDCGLAWGDGDQARIVLPLEMVAKIAASVVIERELRKMRES